MVNIASQDTAEPHDNQMQEQIESAEIGDATMDKENLKNEDEMKENVNLDAFEDAEEDMDLTVRNLTTSMMQCKDPETFI